MINQCLSNAVAQELRGLRQFIAATVIVAWLVYGGSREEDIQRRSVEMSPHALAWTCQERDEEDRVLADCEPVHRASIGALMSNLIPFMII